MAKVQKLPSIDDLRERFVIDPVSPSGLTWRITRNSKAPAGSRAGRRTGQGYWQVPFEGRRLSAHRVVWAMFNGRDPYPAEVDHCDMDPSNNSAENLRLATRSQNARNMRSKSGSSSRFMGVSWNIRDRRWQVQITENGKPAALGTFRCETAAALRYDQAAREIHGKFACLNFAV